MERLAHTPMDRHIQPSSQHSAFALVALPDTQSYTQRYPHIFSCQTEWIRENKEREGIVFVVHEGDVTCFDNELEWRRANKAMSILDGVVPYCLCLGNHDIGFLPDTPRSVWLENRGDEPTHIPGPRDTRFNDFFPYQRYEREAWYGGHKDDRNDNSYCFFEVGCLRFLVLSLEFMPRDETLEWANAIVSHHPDCRVIVLTHGYLFCDNTRLSQSTPAPRHHYVPPADWEGRGNDGEQLWEKLVKLHPNIFLVLCGHVAGVSSDDPKPTGRLTSIGVHGNGVHQLLADYEFLPMGGNGWLRILRFVPALNKIYVRTYSPFLRASLTDEENQFCLDYPMDGPSVAR